MPVMIDIADSRLSQIKGWKIPSETLTKRDEATLKRDDSTSSSTAERQRRKASLVTFEDDKLNKTTQEVEMTNTQGEEACRYFFTFSFFFL